jgi:hypothetical protein
VRAKRHTHELLYTRPPDDEAWLLGIADLGIEAQPDLAFAETLPVAADSAVQGAKGES